MHQVSMKAETQTVQNYLSYLREQTFKSELSSTVGNNSNLSAVPKLM